VKVVLDTNIYISEALFNRYAEDIIKAAERGSFQVYISQYILDEISDVLFTKFGASSRFIHLTVERVSRLAKKVSTTNRYLSTIADPNDHPIGETAINCGADYLVTGDRLLLESGKIHSVEVVSLNSFILVLRNLGKI